MTGETTGGCLCGAVRYRAAREPLFTAICHCLNCRRQSGSAYSIVTGFPAEAVTITGATKVFDDLGESGGRVARHFCPECGSPIVSVVEALPGVTIVKSGTLDGDIPAPTVEVYCDTALAFLPALSGTQRFPRSNIGDAA